MDRNNEKPFKFDLDKEIHFKSDYEIEEMRKISLDPDILITPQDSYIHINGLILLQGEYKKQSNPNDISEGLERTEKQIDQVTKLHDLPSGLVKFTHHFPIDITVPAYRVTNLSNVSVIIQSFDYELPNPNTLKVLSKMEINGISMDTDENQRQKEKSVPTYEMAHRDGDEVEKLKGVTEGEEQLKQPEQEKMIEKLKDDERSVMPVNNFPISKRDYSASSSEEAKKAAEKKPHIKSEIEQPANPWEEETDQQSMELKKIDPLQDVNETKSHMSNKSESQPIQKDEQLEMIANRGWEKPAGEEQELIKQTLQTMDTDEVTEEDVQLISKPLPRETVEHDVDETKDEDDRVDDEPIEDETIDIQMKESEEEDDDIRDVHFLTTIFNHADNESHTQLRIYIVQDGDTVHSIAKRYEVSSLRLLQLNSLSGEELGPGDLLYIPEPLETKS